MPVKSSGQTFAKNLKLFSTDNSDGLYIVKCLNYCEKKSFYLKNGKLAIFTVFNPAYDFQNNAYTFAKLPKDGIFEATILDKPPFI